jgi:fatty acid desaturase
MEKKGGNRFADSSIYIKGGFLIALYICSYILLLSGSLNTILSILFVMIMGLSGVMIVFNIVHDASHNVLFKNRSVKQGPRLFRRPDGNEFLYLEYPA